MSVHDQCLALSDKLIINHVYQRMLEVNADDKEALALEFKEWLTCQKIDKAEIWSIPDLTNKTLRNFFLRAISQDH